MSTTKFAMHATLSLLVASLFAPRPASADVVHADDVIITGKVCAGSADCVSGRAFAGDLELVSGNPEIIFIDNTIGSDDWEIEADASDLEIKNHVDGGLTIDVVRLKGGAPGNSLVIDSQGFLGLGTSAPGDQLHIRGNIPTIRLQDTAAAGRTWHIAGTFQGFEIQDRTAFTIPLFFYPGAPNNSIVVDAAGNFGMGTSTPTEELHIRRASGAGSVRILTDSSDNGPVQWLMKTNSTNRRFVAQDAAGNNQSQILFENGGTIKFLGPSAAVPLMTVSPSGLSLPAAAYCGSNGGVPGPGGCDAVFTPGYQIESIEEHAASMWGNSHLPAVGPTPDGKTIEFNVHQRYFSMLNELEKAHIYIERLNEEVKQQTFELAEKDLRLAELEQRMASMETAFRGRPESRK